MDMRQTDHDQFLDLVYGAAVDPELWAKVIGRLAELTGASSANMIRQDEETGKGGGVRANIDPDAAEPYYGYFGTRNPLHNTPDPRATLRRWTPCVLTDEDKLPKADLMRTEYYNDFCRRFGIHSVLMVRMAVIGMDTVTINLVRPASRPQFDGHEIEFAERVHPHLIRAFDLGRKVAPLRRLTGELATALDLSPHGLFLLDATGKVRHVNRAAEKLLACGDTLRLIGGRLIPVEPGAARQLQALVAAAGASDAEQRAGGGMALPSRSRALPLSVTVTPLPAEASFPLGPQPGVLVCVTDLEAGASLPQNLLHDLFSLTRAEVRLALSLFDGASLRDSAERFGVSQHTVHAQLASIFDKTGVNRQSELVRLVTRLAGLSPG